MRVKLSLLLSCFVILVACEQLNNEVIVDISQGGFSDFEAGLDFEENIIKYNTWVDAATQNGGSERVSVALKAYVENKIEQEVFRLWHSEWPIGETSFAKEEVKRSRSKSDSRVTVIDSMLTVTVPLRGFDFEYRLVYQAAVIDVDGSSLAMPYKSFDAESFAPAAKSIISKLKPKTMGSITYARRMVTFPAKIDFDGFEYSVSPVLTAMMMAEYDQNSGLYIVDCDLNRSFIDTYNNHPSAKMFLDVVYSDGTQEEVLNCVPTNSLSLQSTNPATGKSDWSVHEFYDCEAAPTETPCTVALVGDPIQYDQRENEEGYFDEYGERNYNVPDVTHWAQAISFTFEGFKETAYLLYSNTTFVNSFMIQDYNQLKVEKVSVVSNELEVTEQNNSWYANPHVVISVKFENVDKEFEFRDSFGATYYKAGY